ATKVYLADIDEQLTQKLEAMDGVASFRAIRYVDDLYVFFDIDEATDLLKAKYQIENMYADLLRDSGLTLKQEKSKLMRARQAAASVVQVSCIDFSGSSADEALNHKPESLIGLFDDLSKAINQHRYSYTDFLNAMDVNFSCEESTLPASSVFRNCLYHSSELFRDKRVVAAIDRALCKGNIALSYNTNDMVHCVLNTRDERLVRRLLNNFFLSSRSGSWCSLDALAASSYLLRRGMQHVDLLGLIEKHDSGLAKYCKDVCWADASKPSLTGLERFLTNLLRGDQTSKLEYAFYLGSKASGNVFEQASYYRSFFDRVSTYFRKKKGGRGSWIYKEGDLKKIYNFLDGAEDAIKRAESIRRKNPLVHAGAEMVASPTYEEELLEVIKSLNDLLLRYCECVCSSGQAEPADLAKAPSSSFVGDATQTAGL
ncbi:MAG: Abia family HEPN domain-containing protein, partial [Coriobacteriia bacterium]|nr:Abia family HEPN domain-containing protein [Coriobacteriia bacterium]